MLENITHFCGTALCKANPVVFDTEGKPQLFYTRQQKRVCQTETKTEEFMIHKGSQNTFCSFLKVKSSSDSGSLTCQNQWKVTMTKDEGVKFCSPLHSCKLQDKPINVNVWQEGSLCYTHLKENRVQPKGFPVLAFWCFKRQSDFPVTVYYSLPRTV